MITFHIKETQSKNFSSIVSDPSVVINIKGHHEIEKVKVGGQG